MDDRSCLSIGVKPGEWVAIGEAVTVCFRRDVHGRMRAIIKAPREVRISRTQDSSFQGIDNQTAHALGLAKRRIISAPTHGEEQA